MDAKTGTFLFLYCHAIYEIIIMHSIKNKVLSAAPRNNISTPDLP